MSNAMNFSNKRIRLILGILGLALPWIDVLAFQGFPKSISITYYSVFAVGIFMTVLGATGLLLICYKGYDLQDDIINMFAGIFGLGVCFFPCNCFSPDITTTGLFHLTVEASQIVHGICAICFFCLLSYNSLFLFTKSSGEMTPQKKIRNIIYRVCGIGMLLSFALLLIPNSILYCKTWLTEMFALTFFAVSWLTKSECFKFLAKDKENY